MGSRLLALDDDALRVILADVGFRGLHALSATCKQLRILLMPAIVCALQFYSASDKKVLMAASLRCLVLSSTKATGAFPPNVVGVNREPMRALLGRLAKLLCDLHEQVERIISVAATHPIPILRKLTQKIPTRIRKRVGCDMHFAAKAMRDYATVVGVTPPELPDLTAYPA
tara:strand:+ start:745 stop:1257 length:513 start_codon:yes stop_codon:yes gene_type:complete